MGQGIQGSVRSSSGDYSVPQSQASDLDNKNTKLEITLSISIPLK